jgi:exoribonuclease R
LTGYEHKEYPPVELQIGPEHVRYDKLVAFTIDPATSIDLDDALSIIPIDEKTYEVGIHISDVSSYLKFLDRDHISTLSTSIYLPYEVKHMLPHALVDVCTLRPNVDRLAFSVFLKMNADG